jgi:hypothetical protein
LQVYRVFPDLLSRRMKDNEPEVERDEDLTARVTDDCLFALAMRILETLASINAESRTTPFQAILLLCISSELRFTKCQSIDDSQSLSILPQYRIQTPFPGLPLSNIGLAGTWQNIKVAEAREFVVNRLSISQRQMPGGRLFKLLQGLKEIWSRLDDSKTCEPVYWLDVIIEAVE